MIAEKYPLHLISNQPLRRMHSQLDFCEPSQSTKIAGREPVSIHPRDAEARGLADLATHASMSREEYADLDTIFTSKAPGTSGFKFQMLELMPPEYRNLAAELVNLIITSGRIPPRANRLLVAFLDIKPDGGHRPIVPCRSSDDKQAALWIF